MTRWCLVASRVQPRFQMERKHLCTLALARLNGRSPCGSGSAPGSSTLLAFSKALRRSSAKTFFSGEFAILVSRHTPQRRQACTLVEGNAFCVGRTHKQNQARASGVTKSTKSEADAMGNDFESYLNIRTKSWLDMQTKSWSVSVKKMTLTLFLA